MGKLSAGEQFAALENRRRAHIRLSKTDPEYTIKQARDYIPEERQFLIRKDEFDQLKEEREQFVASGGTGFDENWWKTAMGWNRESLYSGLQNAGKFFTPDILGQITGVKKTATFDISETYGNENTTINRRECDWFMHQFHTCLRRYNKTDNPYLLFPHPDMPSIFNTFGFSTNAALSKKNYFNEDCLEFRLLATQMCDDLEMAEYVRTENYGFKKYWLLAKKAQMKERINKFIFSSEDSENTNAAVNIPEMKKELKIMKEPAFVNPNLLDVDRKYKKMYEERLKNKLNLEV